MDNTYLISTKPIYTMVESNSPEQALVDFITELARAHKDASLGRIKEMFDISVMQVEDGRLTKKI